MAPKIFRLSTHTSYLRRPVFEPSSLGLYVYFTSRSPKLIKGVPEHRFLIGLAAGYLFIPLKSPEFEECDEEHLRKYSLGDAVIVGH